MMSVSVTKISSGLSLSYPHQDPNFLAVQLQYLHTVIPDGEIDLVEVEEVEALLCKGDFRQLLVNKGVPAVCHWLALHIQGYTNPVDFDGIIPSGGIIVPKESFIMNLAQSYLNSQR